MYENYPNANQISPARAYAPDVPQQRSTLIGDLCRANGASVRLGESLSHLAFKLGVGGGNPSAQGMQTSAPQQTPSLTELSLTLADRLELLEKGLAELHQILGER